MRPRAGSAAGGRPRRCWDGPPSGRLWGQPCQQPSGTGHPPHLPASCFQHELILSFPKFPCNVFIEQELIIK